MSNWDTPPGEFRICTGPGCATSRLCGRTNLWLLASLQLGKMLAEGAVGKLWCAPVSGLVKAVKEIRRPSSLCGRLFRMLAQ